MCGELTQLGLQEIETVGQNKGRMLEQKFSEHLAELSALLVFIECEKRESTGGRGYSEGRKDTLVQVGDRLKELIKKL